MNIPTNYGDIRLALFTAPSIRGAVANLPVARSALTLRAPAGKPRRAKHNAGAAPN